MTHEATLSAQLAEFLRLALPPDCFASVFPAGGGGKARGGRLKRMGMVAGVPDWLIVYQGRALFVELKIPGGRLSGPQRATHAWLRSAGALVTTEYGLEAIEGALLRFGVPLKTTVSADWRDKRAA